MDKGKLSYAFYLEQFSYGLHLWQPNIIIICPSSHSKCPHGVVSRATYYSISPGEGGWLLGRWFSTEIKGAACLHNEYNSSSSEGPLTLSQCRCLWCQAGTEPPPGGEPGHQLYKSGIVDSSCNGPDKTNSFIGCGPVGLYRNWYWQHDL